jgi:hypothetical protein
MVIKSPPVDADDPLDRILSLLSRAKSPEGRFSICGGVKNSTAEAGTDPSIAPRSIAGAMYIKGKVHPLGREILFHSLTHYTFALHPTSCQSGHLHRSTLLFALKE